MRKWKKIAKNILKKKHIKEGFVFPDWSKDFGVQKTPMKQKNISMSIFIISIWNWPTCECKEIKEDKEKGINFTKIKMLV
jgi:hypothetical protein